MNYDDRMRITKEKLGRLFTRFSAPKGFDETTKREEAESVARAVVRAMPELSGDGFSQRLDRALDMVADRAKTRSWPTQAEVVSAIRECSKVVPGVTQSRPAQLYDLVVKHYRATGAPLPSAAREEDTKRMVEEGIFTWEEAREHSFPVPREIIDRIIGKSKNTGQYLEAAE